jgi:hypothetical protein
VSKTGATPGSGTVTVTTSPAAQRLLVIPLGATGQHATPIAQNATAGAPNDTTPSVTLGSTPAAHSTVVGVLGFRNSTTATPGAGYQLVAHATSSVGNPRASLSVVTDPTPSSSTVDWVDASNRRTAWWRSRSSRPRLRRPRRLPGGEAGTPSLKVEVAFASTPDAVSPTWTDVTSYVLFSDRPLTIEAGRQDEFSEVGPSRLSVTLDNPDGRFTPGRAASPYYPNVKLGKRIRVGVVYSGVTYWRFDGHVDTWPAEWPGGMDTYAEALVTAADRLARWAGSGTSPAWSVRRSCPTPRWRTTHWGSRRERRAPGTCRPRRSSRWS